MGSAQADQIQTDRWNGLYVGGHIGSGAFDAEARFRGPGFSGTINGDEETEFLGGGQLGYNLQTGLFLIGVEGDFSVATNADLATLRGRLGVATNNVLLYGTAGIGFAWVDDASSDDTLNAFVVGGGAEFDLGQSFRGMTVGVEGLYFAFEEQNGRIIKFFIGKGLAANMSSHLIHLIAANPRIELMAFTEVALLDGGDHALTVNRWPDRRTREETGWAIRNLFLFIGANPASHLLDAYSAKRDSKASC